MKRMYWRPRRVSRVTLALVATASVAGYLAVERFPMKVREPNHEEKLAAARKAEEAFKIIRDERVKRGLVIDTEADPAQSGLVGSLMTPITTNPGSLDSKQTSANPNFAALVVHYLKQAGLEKGDVVAVGYSGSFPAINIAVLSAVEVLELKPVIIASVASSQWGANDPEFTWLDMEQLLVDRGVLTHHASAASLGGIEDRALGMPKKGRRILEDSIQAHGLTYIQPKDFTDSVDQRIHLYRDLAGSLPIKAYINVGGGTVSVGKKKGKKLFRPGLNRRPPAGGTSPDSIMERFVEDGIPVVHLVYIRKLAERFGFPVQPPQTPRVGEGRIFYRTETNPWLVAGLLLGIIGALYLFVRSDLGFRMTRGASKGSDRSQPEPMV
ncbi:MAG: poly-gamma-glutamate system protein [Myxococcales bacterium]|nr:poly-gamma-glutamate system protein [Myxococcales bacterium]